MGMYTTVCLGVQFKKGLPEDILATLRYMVFEEGEPVVSGHPLFKTDRWSWMLRSGGSYFFDNKPVLKFEFDDIARAYYLTVWTDIKNYTREWEQFLSYIGPYVYTGGESRHVGFYRYEGRDDPTLLYAEDGKIQMVEFNRNKGDE